MPMDRIVYISNYCTKQKNITLDFLLPNIGHTQKNIINMARADSGHLWVL